MPQPGLSAAVALARRAAPRTDGQLLAAFLATRDADAFAELVRRLGPMVLAVCRRVTGHRQDAEDAFQAAFLVLARRAAAVAPREAVGNFLYGVAVRVAREARAVSARRRAREVPTPDLPDVARPAPEPDDLPAVLDEELAGLPEKYRTLLVLCDLRGEPQTAVAGRLGLAVGTVYSRLAAARKRLGERLRRRGVGLPATLACGVAVPPALAASASALASPGAAIPTGVAALTTGVFRAMLLRKLTAPAVAVLAVAASVALGLAAGSGPPQPAAAARPAPVPADPKPALKGPNKILVYRAGCLTLIDPDGKNETKVTRGHPELHPVDAKLSPDGTRVAVLYVAAEGVSRKGRLYVRGPDEKEPGTDLGVGCETFFWSADGTEIVYSEFENVAPVRADSPAPTHAVVNVRTKGKTAVKLPARHVITDWSRDGKHFVTTNVRRDDLGAAVKVHLMNRDGTEVKALTDGKSPSAAEGRLSPDGRRVLLMQVAAKEQVPDGVARPTSTLAVLDVATGKTDPVEGVPPGEIRGHCWSPDGSRIAYAWREVHAGTGEDVKEKETKSLLVVCDPDGKNAKTIASEKGPGQFSVMIASPDWR
jgi:RNA polymerase sigma factor (sigma-70 family)